MLLQPTHELTIDSFVDVDFAGQWNVKDPHDPLCVKSWMEMSCPLGFQITK